MPLYCIERKCKCPPLSLLEKRRGRVRLTFHNRVISHQVLIEEAATAFDETSIVKFASSDLRPKPWNIRWTSTLEERPEREPTGRRCRNFARLSCSHLPPPREHSSAGPGGLFKGSANKCNLAWAYFSSANFDSKIIPFNSFNLQFKSWHYRKGAMCKCLNCSSQRPNMSACISWATLSFIYYLFFMQD